MKTKLASENWFGKRFPSNWETFAVFMEKKITCRKKNKAELFCSQTVDFHTKGVCTI